MVQNLEKNRASQRTEEYKIKKRIRDKRYREKHFNPKLKVKLTPEEARKRLRKRMRLKKAKKYARNNEWINNFKKERHCVSCGYKAHPEILHFHHIRGEKKFEISKKKDKSLDTLRAEIEKCVLLCPNCHSLLHSKESDSDFINLVLLDEIKEKRS
ncbi:HNH endonuclease [Candidatus Pacearchaeota archaeon]|nr:HNH endonuclease [Candidatus Pacearchaeota archaeon]